MRYCSILLLLLTGCSDSLKTGTVLSKQHNGSYTIQAWKAVDTTGTGTEQLTKVEHPNSWTIQVAGLDIEHDHPVTKTVYVTKEEWESIKIGDTWTARPTKN